MIKRKKSQVKTTETVVEVAKKRFAIAQQFYQPQRSLAISDTQFVMGDSDNGYQWPHDIRVRQDATVCLTVNITAQHCNQIINNIRDNRPQATVTVSDSKGHKKTADMLAGMIRAIQRDGSGDDATDCAAEHAVYGGEGYWYITPEYADDFSNNQVLRRKIIQNPNLVYIDPFSKELDKSDAEWGFIFDDVSKTEFEIAHPDIDPQSWSESSMTNGWATDKTVRMAIYYYCTYTNKTIYFNHDGSVFNDDELVESDKSQLKSRLVKTKQWKICKLVGGQDDPIDETEWLGKYLPIISVIGKEVNVNGEIIRKGIVRDLKDPARMVNYSYSATVQTLALQNKIPYIAAVEAITGHESEWEGANVQNKAYLPFNSVDSSNRPIPPPIRQQAAVMPAAQIELLRLSTEQMRAASGQQQANFGVSSSSQSGIGIQRLKQQGELATFHFPDNFARAMKYEAKVLLDAIPKYYDTTQMVTIVGIDGAEEKAIIAPDMKSAYHEQDGGKAFNPTLGRYDAVIKVGAAYSTQRQEAAQFMSDSIQYAKDPATSAVITYLAMKYRDIPGADEAEEMMKVLLPPPIQKQLAAKKSGNVLLPPEVEQQMQETEQQMQQALETMQAMEQKLKAAESGQQERIAKIEADKELAVFEAQQAHNLALSKASQEGATKKQLLEMQIASDEEIEEMKGYFSLLVAEKSKSCAALGTEQEFKPDVSSEPILPRILMRKRMQIQAPSGQVYNGTIDDELIPQDELMSNQQE